MRSRWKTFGDFFARTFPAFEAAPQTVFLQVSRIHTVRLSPWTNKQQMLKCLLWLILDLRYRVPFSYTSTVFQRSRCIKPIFCFQSTIWCNKSVILCGSVGGAGTVGLFVFKKTLTLFKCPSEYEFYLKPLATINWRFCKTICSFLAFFAVYLCWAN